jgi:hypothetical protein
MEGGHAQGGATSCKRRTFTLLHQQAPFHDLADRKHTDMTKRTKATTDQLIDSIIKTAVPGPYVVSDFKGAQAEGLIRTLQAAVKLAEALGYAPPASPTSPSSPTRSRKGA